VLVAVVDDTHRFRTNRESDGFEPGDQDEPASIPPP
jgi:hypothetical protein